MSGCRQQNRRGRGYLHKEDIPKEYCEQEKAVLEPHNFRIQDNDLAGGPKAKYKANIGSLSICYRLRERRTSGKCSNNRKSYLVMLAGRGGILYRHLRKIDSSWANEYLEIKNNYHQKNTVARVLTLNKPTSPTVIRSGVWSTEISWTETGNILNRPVVSVTLWTNPGEYEQSQYAYVVWWTWPGFWQDRKTAYQKKQDGCGRDWGNQLSGQLFWSCDRQLFECRIRSVTTEIWPL